MQYYLIWILGFSVTISFFLTLMIQETPNWYSYVVKHNEEISKDFDLKRSENTEEL